MISLIESSMWLKYLTEITDVAGLHLWTKICKYKRVHETLMIFLYHLIFDVFLCSFDCSTSAWGGRWLGVTINFHKISEEKTSTVVIWLNIVKFWVVVKFSWRYEQHSLCYVGYKIQDFSLVGQKYLGKYFVEHHMKHLVEYLFSNWILN